MSGEKYFQENKKNWAKEVTTGRLFYPDENVVRFAAARRNGNPQDKQILDYGCGAGRHSVAMLNMGYKVVGMDYNKECLDATVERIEETFDDDFIKESFQAIQNEGEKLTLSDACLDYIVAWGSLFYNGRDKFKEVLCEMHRVLKKDGELFFDFRTQKDFLYGKGQELEKDFFYLDKDSGYGGFTYLILTLDELKEIVEKCGFQITNVETYEFTKNNGSKLNSWYHVTAKK